MLGVIGIKISVPIAQVGIIVKVAAIQKKSVQQGKHRNWHLTAMTIVILIARCIMRTRISLVWVSNTHKECVEQRQDVIGMWIVANIVQKDIIVITPQQKD